MIGAMFGILGVSLFLLGLQVVRLSVLQGLDLQVVGKIKCKVRWLMAVTITAFAIKMVSFLISPISGYGFGGDLCNAMYPWFFYPVPEALPVSRVPPLTSALLEMRTPPLPPNTPPTLTRGAHLRLSSFLLSCPPMESGTTTFGRLSYVAERGSAAQSANPR
jgi:hypothetical protein